MLSFKEALDNFTNKSPLSDLWYSILVTISRNVLKGEVAVTGAISVFETFIRRTGLKGMGMVKHTSMLS